MSEYTAIRGVTQTLHDLLRGAITDSIDPDLNGIEIRLFSPREFRDQQLTGVSLWLYRVVRNGDLLNLPPERLAPDLTRRPPIPVNLYYLVTPFTEAPADEQLVIGRVLQVFNDRQILRGALLHPSLGAGRQEFRLTLEPLGLEELTRVWDALKEPYQLSLSYLVQVVTIDSDLDAMDRPPVEIREAEYDQILEVS